MGRESRKHPRGDRPLKPTLREPLERLVTAYEAGRNLALLFDYDGTLVPLASHPQQAKLPSDHRRLLQTLATQPRIHVGIISGRMLDDLKEMVALPDLFYSGTSGMEFDLCGTPLRHPQADRAYALFERLSPPLQEVAKRYAGAWLEKKPLGLTLHYRAVAPQDVASIRQEAQRLLQPLAGEVRFLDGVMAVEVTAAFGWTKRTAVRIIVDHVGENTLPLYAGDDANDADALEEVQALDGIGLRIGPHTSSAARYCLPDPAALLSLLSSLLEVLKSR